MSFCSPDADAGGLRSQGERSHAPFRALFADVQTVPGPLLYRNNTSVVIAYNPPHEDEEDDADVEDDG